MQFNNLIRSNLELGNHVKDLSKPIQSAFRKYNFLNEKSAKRNVCQMGIVLTYAKWEICSSYSLRKMSSYHIFIFKVSSSYKLADCFIFLYFKMIWSNLSVTLRYPHNVKPTVTIGTSVILICNKKAFQSNAYHPLTDCMCFSATQCQHPGDGRGGGIFKWTSLNRSLVLTCTVSSHA